MTFSSRRKLPTTAACATARRRPTAIEHARLALALAAGWLAAFVPAHAQESPFFRTIVFSQAPRDDPSGAVVEPDASRTILRTGGQLQSKSKTSDDDVGFNIRTDLPGPDRLFDARKSEAMMREYIRRDTDFRSGSGRIHFPEYPVLTHEKYTGRQFARSTTMVEPNYVCHGRLYFEQPNFERGGWDLGAITPGVSLGVFYYDVLMFPYHAWTNPCVCYDCNTGKCLPGDQSPFLLYREPFSVSGLAAQSLAVGGAFFIFP
jgi:hypothetical protein